MRTYHDFMPALPGVMTHQLQHEPKRGKCTHHVFHLRGADFAVPTGWSIAEMQAAIEALKEARLQAHRQGRFSLVYERHHRGGDCIFTNELGEYACSDGTAPHECENGPYIVDLAALTQQPTLVEPGCGGGLVACVAASNRYGEEFPVRMSIDAYAFLARTVGHPDVEVRAHGVVIKGTIDQLVSA